MFNVQIEKLATITGHNDCVYTLAGGASPNQFFSGAGDGMVVLWDQADTENGQLIAKLPNSVYALHYFRPTNVVIAGHNYDGIHILDWENKKESGSLQLSKAAIFDIQSSGRNVLIASGDGSLHKIDVSSLRVVTRIQPTDKSARTIAVNETLGEVAVGFSDNFVRVFDLDTLTLKHEWLAHENSVFTVRYTPDGNYLMTGSRDARLKAWDAKAGYKQAAEVVAHLFAINHMEFSPDAKHFVTCSLDKSIKVWDANELRLLKVIDRARHGGHRTSVNKVLWTNHHDQLLSASDDRTIAVWHIIF
jgi:WD40 repeat protein